MMRSSTGPVNMKTRGNLIVISGPSGSGKGTICSALLAEMPDLHLSVSATTRGPRNGEKDGVDYYFLTRVQFEQMIAGGRFLEWAEVYGCYYGTPRGPVEEAINQGKDVVLEIDVQGALQVKTMFPGSVLIFLIPPSRAELERRLKNRGTESAEAIEQRLNWVEKEIKQAGKYDYLVVNDEVTAAVRKISAIITAERCRPGLLDIDSFLQQYW